MPTPPPDAALTARLNIRAAAEEVRRASEWMSRLATLQGVPDAQIDRLDLCLNEALANIIAHGDAAAQSQPVQLCLQLSTTPRSHQAAVTVSDAGPAFDMAHAPLGERPRTLAEAEPGGLGLLMLRSFSDTLEYRRVDQRNVLTFAVRWAATPGA